MNRRVVWLTLGLAALCAIAALVALRLGAAEGTAQIVWEIRAPRVVMALLIGAGLGLAGALMQGSLGNPLADPALVGISAGAALAAVAGAALGLTFGSLAVGLVATVGAAIAAAVVVAASQNDGRPEVVTLLLAGVAVTAFAGALLAVLVTLTPAASGRSLTFWSSGSLALSTWNAVVAVAPFVIVGAATAGAIAHPLDVLALGDRAASASGINVRRVRISALGAVVLLIGAGVGTVGVIAFVGLLVPHAVRAVVGPRHGSLLLVSGLAGALLLLLADTVARLLANPLEIPIGAVTAAVGAPAFFVLLRRTRARQGGWA